MNNVKESEVESYGMIVKSFYEFEPGYAEYLFGFTEQRKPCW